VQGAGGRSEPDRASTSGLRLDARLLWIVFCGDAGFLRFAFALAKVMESDYRALFGIRSMKHLAALTLVALLGPAVHAGGSLKEARKLWLQGNYAEAQEMYADLGKDSAAVIGLSKAHQSQGQYDKAQQVVEKALKLFARPPADLLARHAELLYLQGQWNEAEKAAEAAIAASADSFLGHWVLAQVLRDKGEIKSADDEYRWFVRAYNDKEITDPDNLLLVGLASLERARLHHLHDQFQVVIDDLFNEALKKDKDYWPAAYEKGRIFLERHDKKDAYTAFEKALTINPQAAEVLAAKAEMAAMGLEMTDAAEFADEALKINPNLTAALRIMADVQSFSGENDKAVKNLEKARSINPRDEETLGRIAAGLVVQRKNAEFQAIVKEVEKYNQKPYDFYVVLASQLDGRKVYLDAEKYFKVAADLQPKLPQAQAGLGMMYMRMGREPEALKALEEAYAADKFDVRVINTLKVLDHLKKYQTIETEHFTLRYDPKNDEVLAKYMARYLEQLHKEYAGLFGHQPEGKILIEVFSKHEMFSGRVVAIPDLHTIGACTGRMFAMVSVHDTSKVIPKPFNWVRVLRHELVHIFNLDQTKFLCPHWFTEGLAVTHEGSATPLNWMQILAEKRAADDLLNLDNILLGFVRPRNQTQWHQAYAQSQHLRRQGGRQDAHRVRPRHGHRASPGENARCQKGGVRERLSGVSRRAGQGRSGPRRRQAADAQAAQGDAGEEPRRPGSAWPPRRALSAARQAERRRRAGRQAARRQARSSGRPVRQGAHSDRHQGCRPRHLAAREQHWRRHQRHPAAQDPRQTAVRGQEIRCRCRDLRALP